MSTSCKYDSEGRRTVIAAQVLCIYALTTVFATLSAGVLNLQFNMALIWYKARSAVTR
jgi:hypothetical protein